MNTKSILNKEIHIKTNLLTILIICTLLVVSAALYLTNGVQNLMFATLSAEQIDTITIYEQFGDKNAILLEDDVEELVPQLRKVWLVGHSVRLVAAESMNPQYTVQLKNGICFDIACYEDHYIINGRGYAAEGPLYDNYTAVGQRYFEHLENREYFPREADREGLS